MSNSLHWGRHPNKSSLRRGRDTRVMLPECLRIQDSAGTSSTTILLRWNKRLLLVRSGENSHSAHVAPIPFSVYIQLQVVTGPWCRLLHTCVLPSMKGMSSSYLLSDPAKCFMSALSPVPQTSLATCVAGEGNAAAETSMIVQLMQGTTLAGTVAQSTSLTSALVPLSK